MGILIVLIGEQIQYSLSDELLAINKCGSSEVLNDSSIPKCFRPSHNDSVPSTIVQATELTNSTNTVTFCLALTIVNLFILVVCLRPKYKRMESEKRASFEKSIAE